jgi:Tol biopolymer transport system component
MGLLHRPGTNREAISDDSDHALTRHRLRLRWSWLVSAIAGVGATTTALLGGSPVLSSRVLPQGSTLPASVRDEGPIACSAEPLEWSPDHEWLAYTEFRSEGPGTDWDLFVVRSDGTDKRQLSVPNTSADFGVSGFDWSPDGSQIAYVYKTKTHDDSSYLAVQTVDGDPVRVVEGFERMAYPVWSPDGSQIAFGAADERPGVYVVPASGGEVSLVTSRLAGAFYPSDWSSDGKSIGYMYQRRWGPDVTDVGWVDVASGEVHVLPHRAYRHSLLFSPDASQVAYIQYSKGSDLWGLWTADPDAQHRQLVARWREPLHFTFDWSPSGEYITYLRGRHWDAIRSDVFVSTSDGASRWRVTDTYAFELWVDWRAET